MASELKSGVEGVYWHAVTGKWAVTNCGKHLGVFEDLAEAIALREKVVGKIGCLGLRPGRLTQEIVREFLDYDSETGIFRWKERGPKWFVSVNAWRTWNSRFVGKVAGTPLLNGYVGIAIFTHTCFAHRLAFLWMTGEIPALVDHKNGVRHDNRWVNLNASDHAHNKRNVGLRSDSKSGHVGISKDKATGRWNAFVNVNGKAKRIGRFNTIEEAIVARQKASEEHGYSGNHGVKRAYRQRTHGVDGRYTAEDIELLRAKQTDCCAAPHCRVPLVGGGEVDHVAPLARGGSNRSDNLQLLCKPCNRQKTDKPMAEWVSRQNAA